MGTEAINGIVELDSYVTLRAPNSIKPSFSKVDIDSSDSTVFSRLVEAEPDYQFLKLHSQELDPSVASLRAILELSWGGKPFHQHPLLEFIFEVSPQRDFYIEVAVQEIGIDGVVTKNTKASIGMSEPMIEYLDGEDEEPKYYVIRNSEGNSLSGTETFEHKIYKSNWYESLTFIRAYASERQYYISLSGSAQKAYSPSNLQNIPNLANIPGFPKIKLPEFQFRSSTRVIRNKLTDSEAKELIDKLTVECLTKISGVVQKDGSIVDRDNSGRVIYSPNDYTMKEAEFSKRVRVSQGNFILPKASLLDESIR